MIASLFYQEDDIHKKPKKTLFGIDVPLQKIFHLFLDPVVADFRGICTYI